MPFTTTDDVRIRYETFGDAADPAIVLIAGGGAQMLAWQPAFCALLAAGGLRVIRFDHRDTGESTMFGDAETLDGGYELDDLALDVLRILDTEGIERAHVLGHSMGGIVAQLLVLDHPARLRSATLFGTIPGIGPQWVVTPGVPESATSVQPILPKEQVVAGGLPVQRWMNGDDYPFDEDDARQNAELAYDRGHAPSGLARQWAAMARAQDRLERLRTVDLPVLVLHGRDDPVLHWRAAVDLALAIPGAELHVWAGLGHLLPQALWVEATGIVLRHVGRADAAEAGDA